MSLCSSVLNKELWHEVPGGYKQPEGGMNRVKLLPPPTSQGSVSSPYIMGTANLLLCQNLNTEERVDLRQKNIRTENKSSCVQD